MNDRYNSVPIGTIICSACPEAPEGYCVCDGRSLEIEEHPALYAAIGRTYGGDQRSFRIPDLRGLFIRSLSFGGSFDYGREIGSLQQDAIVNHSHSMFVESTKTKKDGSHDHYIGYESKYFGTNLIVDNAECKSLVGHSDPHVLSYGDGSRAIHEHELPKIEVRDIDNKGEFNSDIANEIRPVNIALPYYIKIK